MKNQIVALFLVIFSITLFGQEVKLSTDKEAYKFDEIVQVTFEINAKSDSMNLPGFDGLKIISGPNKSSSFSFKNGEQSVQEILTFSLRPMESGRITINSPTYFIEGEKVEGKPMKIKVDPSTLNAEDLEENKYKEFIEDGIKPKGTTRIIFHENKGYIEIFGDLHWEFLRRLTQDEIDEINKIK